MHTPSDMSAEIVSAIAAQGWYLGSGLYSQELCHALLQELKDLEENVVALREAAIGDRQAKVLKPEIRNTLIHWLNTVTPTPAQQEYLRITRKLMNVLKQDLFLPMNAYEAHFALYPPGGFYKKHLDGFQGRQARLVTVVLYLNQQWPADSGGELLIYKENEPLKVDVKVTPTMGSFVVFLSQSIYHEVLPTDRRRFSLAGWMRYNEITADPLAILNPSL